MTEGRKTTFEERIKIVEYCLKEDKNYQKTAEYFQVSYQKVYSWIKKYEKDGVRALKDNRGRGKSVEDMTELERLTAENKLLQAKIEQLEVEKELKKKSILCVETSIRKTILGGRIPSHSRIPPTN